MQHKSQRGMVEINGYVMAYPGAEAQFDVPMDLQEIYQCANQECDEGENSSL